MITWKRIKELLLGKPRQVQTVEAGGVGIQAGGDLHMGSFSVKSKGSQSITFEGGKMVVYADDPQITAPPGADIEVRPLKDRP